MYAPTSRRIAGLLATAIISTLPLSATILAPSATADPCPDAEVVYARGTYQPPGLDEVGQAFVDALRPQVGGKNVAAYSVNYPATDDFAQSVRVGVNDASAHVQATAANCRQTRIVLSGYSQGASVIDIVSGVLPAEVANHVAAVALFGNPKSAFADSLSRGPLPSISPLYSPKTIDLCVPGDLICSDGRSYAAHGLYVPSGMTNQAATFVANRLVSLAERPSG
jgi:cutinase